jgi:hypothetical protein
VWEGSCEPVVRAGWRGHGEFDSNSGLSKICQWSLVWKEALITNPSMNPKWFRGPLTKRLCLSKVVFETKRNAKGGPRGSDEAAWRPTTLMIKNFGFRWFVFNHATS